MPLCHDDLADFYFRLRNKRLRNRETKVSLNTIERCIHKANLGVAACVD